VADKHYQLLIIGGGPGGYVAAIRAAQLGIQTALVEREDLGGVCLNWGCIPTKALLKSAEVYSNILHAKDYGVTVDNVQIDIQAMVARSRAIASQLNGGVGHLLKKNKIEVITGEARLLGAGRIQVSSADKAISEISADNIILATGSRPREIPGLEPDGQLVWTAREAMTPEELPKSLLVMGAGAIGVEFASFYNTLGVDVTLVEMMSQIVPVEDEEIAQIARDSFEKQGIKVMTDTKVLGITRGSDSVTVVLEQAGSTTELTVDRIISAIGVVGNHEDLALENTSVQVERSFVITNEWCETAEAGVFAIGDLAGVPCLAHKASHEGIICVERIARNPLVHPLDKNNIPGCTYSDPEIASVGLTEKSAIDSGLEVKVGRFPFLGNGKAIAMGKSEGLVKTVFDAKTGELLGAHMIGAGVTELIQGFGVAISLETTEQELMNTVFPHPTLSEMMHESVLDAYDRVLHF